MQTRARREAETSLSVDTDLIGGSIALNLINTLRSDAGEPMETLRNDKDVLAWMKKMGLQKPALRNTLPKGALLQSARELRAAALTAVQQKKAGKRIHLAALNRLLADVNIHPRLRQRKDAVELYREYFADSAPQFLAPVVEAIADLLAHGNFHLIRQCEGAGCVLWFLDRSNGRPRRFCTEEACGTRTRVAAFRAKQTQPQAHTASSRAGLSVRRQSS